jgi:broad specificity phosphatase PhoE
MIALLVRHGHVDSVDRWLEGRRDSVRLNAMGRQQASSLSDALSSVPIAAVYTSPLRRALETAEPVAAAHRLPINVREALVDVDFGEWTGKHFDELSHDPRWLVFNRSRADACAPGGEPLDAVRRRIEQELLFFSRRHSGQTIVVVTHAEPIRCAIAAFRKVTLDEVLGVEILPGRISTVQIDAARAAVVAVNRAPNQAAVCADDEGVRP